MLLPAVDAAREPHVDRELVRTLRARALDELRSELDDPDAPPGAPVVARDVRQLVAQQEQLELRTPLARRLEQLARLHRVPARQLLELPDVQPLVLRGLLQHREAPPLGPRDLRRRRVRHGALLRQQGHGELATVVAEGLLEEGHTERLAVRIHSDKLASQDEQVVRIHLEAEVVPVVDALDAANSDAVHVLGLHARARTLVGELQRDVLDALAHDLHAEVRADHAVVAALLLDLGLVAREAEGPRQVEGVIEEPLAPERQRQLVAVSLVVPVGVQQARKDLHADLLGVAAVRQGDVLVAEEAVRVEGLGQVVLLHATDAVRLRDVIRLGPALCVLSGRHLDGLRQQLAEAVDDGSIHVRDLRPRGRAVPEPHPEDVGVQALVDRLRHKLHEVRAVEVEQAAVVGLDLLHEVLDADVHDVA